MDRNMGLAADRVAPGNERQFKHHDMPCLQDEGLPKAVNQKELDSGAGDGA